MSKTSIEDFENAAIEISGNKISKLFHIFHRLFNVPVVWIAYRDNYWTACYTCMGDLQRQDGPPPTGALFVEYE